MLDRIRECLPAGAYADIQPVFGLDFFVVRGVAFAASHQGDLVVRLDEEAREEALGLQGSATWGPNPDVEEEYVIIPYAYVSSDDMLRYWVTEAYEFAEQLASSDQVPTYGGDMPFEEHQTEMFSESVMDALPPAVKPKKDKKKAAPKPAKKPAAKAAAKPAKKAAPKKKAAAKPAKKKAAKPAKKKAAPKKAAKKKAAPKKKAAAKKAMKKKAAKKAPGKKKAAKKAPARKKAPAKKKAAAKKKMARKKK